MKILTKFLVPNHLHANNHRMSLKEFSTNRYTFDLHLRLFLLKLPEQLLSGVALEQSPNKICS